MLNPWPERRPRHAVRLVAQVARGDGEAMPIEVTNLSLDGCCLTGAFLIGERLTLTIPQVGRLTGQVRWAVLDQAGVRFERSSG